MKALVTGGGGFLGQAIVRQLLERGDTVRSFSRQEHPGLRGLCVEQFQGDLGDATAVQKAVAGCDTVFHVAAKAGLWGSYEEFFSANVTGTENIIAACRQHGVHRLVYTSSPSVVFDGKDMEGVNESVPYPQHYEANYPRTKAMAEQIVMKANDKQLATVSLRPHLIWGPGDNHLLPRMVARARAGQLRRIGHQLKMVDTIYVDNAAEAHLLAADRLSLGAVVGGKTYFISQGEPIESWNMINQMLQAAGVPKVERSVPLSVALALAWGFETVHKITGNTREPRLTRFLVKEISTSHWFDISAARRDLGYAPRVSTEEGMRRLRESLVKQSAA